MLHVISFFFCYYNSFYVTGVTRYFFFEIRQDSLPKRRVRIYNWTETNSCGCRATRPHHIHSFKIGLSLGIKILFSAQHLIFVGSFFIFAHSEIFRWTSLHAKVTTIFAHNSICTVIGVFAV